MMQYHPPRYLFRRYEIVRNIKSGGKFLEIGGGNLMLSQELLNYFEHGTVLDPAESTLEIYNRLQVTIKKKLSLLTQDFFAANMDEVFDCIIACEVLEHVRDDSAFLAKTHQLLNNDGQLILSVPAKMKFWSNHDEMTGHIRRYEKNNLAELLKKAGFEEIKIISYGYPFINILRIPRIILSLIGCSKKESWSQQKKTMRSGPDQLPPLFKYSWWGLFTNPCLFYPLNLIASLFNNYDLSDGYLAIAFKRK